MITICCKNQVLLLQQFVTIEVKTVKTGNSSVNDSYEFAVSISDVPASLFDEAVEGLPRFFFGWCLN